jgi:hypothetical protein
MATLNMLLFASVDRNLYCAIQARKFVTSHVVRGYNGLVYSPKLVRKVPLKCIARHAFCKSQIGMLIVDKLFTRYISKIV